MIGSNVYAILQNQGLIVSGGRIHGVGVGGYLLGGGFSYLTGEVSVQFCIATLADELTFISLAI